MAVIAAVRAIQRLVAALDVAVCVFGMVRADDAAPALVVDPRQHHVVVRQPRQHVVLAGVAYLDALDLGGVGFRRHNAQRRAHVIQRVLAVRVELDQPRLEVVPAPLQVDAAGDAAVADGVGRAWVSVARVGDGGDGCGEVGLGRLFAEGVAPLERPFGRFHDPRRGQRRLLRLGADVVQHHEQNILDVLGLGRWLAVREAVNDERPRVDVPRLARLDVGLGRQERREGCLRRPIAVVDHLAADQRRLLLQQQRRLARLERQLGDVFYKLDAILTHRSTLSITLHDSHFRVQR